MGGGILFWSCLCFRQSVIPSVTLFVYAPYPETEAMDFDQILHMHWYRQDLGWDCYTSIFVNLNLKKSYGPWCSLLKSEFLFPLNILRKNWWNSIKLCICIDIKNVYIRIATCRFPQTYNRVMALDCCQNFVSAQYLENKVLDFDQILHMLWYWQDLGCDYYTSISANLQQIMALDCCQNLVSAQYLEYKLMDFEKFGICVDIKKI